MSQLLLSPVEKICNVLLALNILSVRKEKEDLLKKNDSPELRFCLETLLNPYLTYGVKKIGKTVTREVPPTLEELQDVRNQLATRAVTGKAAIKLLEDTVNCADENIRKCLAGIFVKDLRLGADVKTINKVFPGFIPTFELGLCEKFNDLPEFEEKQLPKGRWAMEPKYDGLRGVIVIDHTGKCQVYSRSGKEMYNTEYITNDLQKLNLTNMVFDGEIFGGDWNSSIGIAHTQSDHPDKENLKFHIFDSLSFDEWNSQKSTVPYYLRKAHLKNIFEKGEFRNIVLAPKTAVATYNEAVVEYKKRLAEGYEGIVLKDMDSVYPFGRNRCWLKWKPVQTVDVQIVKFCEGTGRNEGRLGAITCVYEGVETDIGGGFSDELRIKFWNEREEMVGRILEVECQSITKDGKLLFPEFVRFRVDRD